MTSQDYQRESARTLIPEPDHAVSGHDMMLVWCAIGLVGEAGEAADYIKKSVFHQHGLDPSVLDDELGDILWYIASLCTLAGIDLEGVMQNNVAKVKARYPNGYNSRDSRHT